MSKKNIPGVFYFQQTENYFVPIKRKWWQFWIPRQFTFTNRRYWRIDGTMREAEAFANIMTSTKPGYQGTDVNISVIKPTLQVAGNGGDKENEAVSKTVQDVPGVPSGHQGGGDRTEQA